MAYDTSLLGNDPGYYEFRPNHWLPGKIVPPQRMAWPQRAIDAAMNLELKDTDIIIATYPKTGKEQYFSFRGRSIVKQDVWRLIADLSSIT